jgi:hypothetical protein
LSATSSTSATRWKQAGYQFVHSQDR